ncbi:MULTISPECIES: hypothetical protein [unclassified Sphingomonas]|jgi:Tfp pilus assembly protein PilF|nr:MULTISPECIES: hypothetical protein [unclassified Sphingomonas]
MDRDDDIARLLPEPPPSRPARRDATIALAMRRFDGDGEPAAAARPGPAATRARWWNQRTQIGALASVLLVGVIAIPLALQTLEEAPSIPHPPRPAIEPTVTTEPAAPRAAIAKRSTSRARRESSPSPSSPAPLAAVRPAPEPGPEARAELQRPAPAPLYAAPASQDLATAHEGFPAQAPQSTMAAAQPEPTPSQPIVVTGNRLAARAAISATPVTVVSGADTEELVVTATRKARARKADRRGDWNACTVQDPERSLRGCKRLVDPGAKGEAGIAAARLADGLARAWQDDWRGAIDALDQAIAVQPKLAFAYLNRGLAHGHEGDLARAEADLDLAIRYAPHTARGYYNRSLVRRMRGDERGANADMAQAEELDSRYAALAD